VHAKCYGIEGDIETRDWYCCLCQAFQGPDIFKVECSLCGYRGGAMRPTNLSHQLFLELSAGLKRYEACKTRAVDPNHIMFEVGARIDQSIELESTLRAERRGESRYREKVQGSYKA
jgi:hypothetical protein